MVGETPQMSCHIHLGVASYLFVMVGLSPLLSVVSSVTSPSFPWWFDFFLLAHNTHLYFLVGRRHIKKCFATRQVPDANNCSKTYTTARHGAALVVETS